MNPYNFQIYNNLGNQPFSDLPNNTAVYYNQHLSQPYTPPINQTFYYNQNIPQLYGNIPPYQYVNEQPFVGSYGYTSPIDQTSLIGLNAIRTVKVEHPVVSESEKWNVVRNIDKADSGHLVNIHPIMKEINKIKKFTYFFNGTESICIPCKRKGINSKITEIGCLEIGLKNNIPYHVFFRIKEMVNLNDARIIMTEDNKTELSILMTKLSYPSNAFPLPTIEISDSKGENIFLLKDVKYDKKLLNK